MQRKIRFGYQKKKNYFVNLDLEFQIRSILSDAKILEAVIQKYEELKKKARNGGYNQLEIRDM